MTRRRNQPPDMDAADGPIQENAENFSLQDFVGRGLGWDTIEGKSALFAPVFANLVNDDFIMREVVGQTGARMPVRDRRTGQVRDVLMLGSNNYLGLANEPDVIEKTIDAVRRFGVGCGGPPLLNGYTTLHRELEERLAAFKHCEAAMLFSAGFMANLGWATGLLGPGDVLVYDQQSHASLYDAIQLGRFEAVHFNHNDIDHLRRRLMQVRWKHAFTNVIVCVEGVYSMDGDIAPLPEVRRLCDQYAALLAIDDAHGTGVLGERGGGTPEHFGMDGQIDLVMGTFSKIFAVSGGFVAGQRAVINYLRLLSRPYMFSASLPPPVVGAVLAGLDFLRDHPERVRQLHDNVAYLVSGLRAVGFETDVQTAIIPIAVPAPIDLHRVINRLFEEGIFVNGVEYPAVPRDRHRIRMSVMATLTRADLDYVIDRTAKVGRELGFLGSTTG
ncbi:MAG: aminotransferase class I/II-fold pyridoxal phosphate-dependent enzyme [Acidobacteriota bacterium]